MTFYRVGSEPKHLPDEAEIAAKCAEIQAGWSECEERTRRLGRAVSEKRVETEEFRAVRTRNGMFGGFEEVQGG